MQALAQTDIKTRSDVKELTEETSAIVRRAKSFVIKTNVSYELAAEELKRIKGAAKKLDDIRKAITQPMDAAKKAVMDFFRAPAESLIEAEGILKDEMRTYLAEVSRKAAAERAAAERAAAEERERLAVSAAKAAETGAVEEAQAIAEQMSTAVAIPIIREAPLVQGIATVERWAFEITDTALIPREYLLIDESKIRKVVAALKKDCAIPGIRVYPETIISARRA